MVARGFMQVFTPLLCCFAYGLVNANDYVRNAFGDVGRISVRGPWMVDGFGRVRLFHGFTSVRRSPPYYYRDMLNATRLKLLQEWGLNVVRLGAMWSGVESREDAYNSTYVDTLKNITELLRKHEIWAMLDLHQDVMSSLFHSYDGLPLWLVKKFPKPRHTFPWPLKAVPDSSWFDRYYSEAVSEAFQHLYNNTAGSMDKLCAFWTRLAKVFRDDPNVLGYELLNEPWYGDYYANPKLYLPGVAGKLNLMPMYNKLNYAIRMVDRDTIIFYEPVVAGMTFFGKYLGSGFDQVPGGNDYRNRSVFSYHYYCNLVTPQNGHKPYSLYNRLMCDHLFLPNLFTRVKQDVDVTGGGSILSEFGACIPDGNRYSTYTQQCNAVLHGADQHLQSWIYWDSAFFSPDGHVDDNVVTSFARTYARATSGIPQKMRYDVDSAIFYFSYKQDQGIKEPTEIFVPKFRYPGGPLVKVSAGFAASWDPKNSVVLIRATNKKATFCEVNISPM